MRWRHVERNWQGLSAAILERWPEADENELIRIDGDAGAFLAYIAELTGEPPESVADDVREWAEGELPADAVLDEHHDNASIQQAGRYVPPGEDPSDDDRRFGDDNTEEPPVGRS